MIIDSLSVPGIATLLTLGVGAVHSRVRDRFQETTLKILPQGRE
jgi:hypothetical protein